MSTTFQININGINEVSQKYKVKALEEMVHTSEKFIPYFSVIESHMKPRNLDNEISIKDYSIIRSDRPIIYKGGVIIYTHKDFVVDDQDTYADNICQSAMAYNSKNNMILAAVYRPGGADSNSFLKCLQKIESFISKHKDSDFHLYGDFNMRFVNWQTKEFDSSLSYLKTDKICAQELIKMMDKHMLNQMVTEYTRKDISILDLVITNNW